MHHGVNRRQALGALGVALMPIGWSTKPSSLLVPAYFPPAVFPAQWARLTDSRLLAVVLNVANGPGTARIPEFADAVRTIEAAGGTVVGYLDTGYGTRPRPEIETEAARYREWYGVSDVLLDQVSADAEALEGYRRICARLRRCGAEFIVANHGVYPDPGYMDLADLLITFEGPWSAYGDVRPPDWTSSPPAERFCHLVYATPPESLDAAFRLAGQRNTGVMYVTDGTGANPWGGLASYFERELALLCAS